MDLLALARDWGKAAGEELSGLLGSAVSLKPPQVEVVERAQVAGDAEHVAHTVCRTQDDAADPVHIVVSRQQAVTLVSVQKSFPEERVEQLRSGGLDEESLDAYREVQDLAISVLGRVCQEKGGIPALQREDIKEVTDPAADPSWLPEGSYRVARFPMLLAGHPDGELRLVFAGELADRWFGPLESSGEAEDDGRPVALLDPDEEVRLGFEELEESLGRPLLSMDSAEFGAEMIEELAESRAIVVAWDLGGRPGLELLETLLHDERTRHIPVALASEAPTGPMVTSAIRYGAATFLSKPWEIGELQRRLFPGAAAPTKTADPVEKAADSKEDGPAEDAADAGAAEDGAAPEAGEAQA